MQTTTTPAASAPPAAPAPATPPARAPFSLSRWFHLVPEDGILTMILLVVVVFTTVASIQSVTPAWAPGLEVLTGTTAAGLLLGYLSVQQRLLPNWLIQILAMALGVYFSFFQTANQIANGDRGALWQHTRIWFQQAIVQRQSSDDNDVFLLFLAILTFLLAYISVWLVARTRRPWLAALANGVVLLINLNSTTDDRSVFFIVLFLLGTLLLLVRFTLSENMRYWRGRGLRFSPDLSWDFMQAGAIFVVIVLLFAYLLPAGPANSVFSDYWNSPTNPWQVLEARVAVVFNGAGGNGNGSINFFGTSLHVSSTVVLPDVPVLQYSTPTPTIDDATQYLVTETFDSYNGQNEWGSSTTSSTDYAANVPQPSTTIYAKPNNYKITIIRAMGGNHLFAPGDEAAQFSVPSQVTVNTAQMSTSWSASGVVTPGQSYSAQGYVSTATTAQLSAVPYPTAAPAGTYPINVLQEYLFSTPTNSIAPDVVTTAQSVTRGASNMYEAAVDLENYLRQFRYSLTNPAPPAGEDAISFFLKTQQGFCTHFATAMAIMGRALGMPTRVALGFSAGRYDNNTHTFVVRGTEAHVWPQIYFAQYGWINFEPTSSFTKFSRPIAIGPDSTSTPFTGGAGASTTPTPRGGKGLPDTNIGPTSPGQSSSSPLIDVGLGLSLLIVLVLLFLALIGVWWRIIYRGLPPVSAAFARVTTLGRWAGAPPRRSQTPIEYAEALGSVVPAERTSLRRLGEIYSRERWGGGADRESLEELPRLYEQVRLAISRVIVRRLRSMPLGRLLRGRRTVRDRFRRY